ncbi:hypothetical protein EYR38_000151 [Pleurotus pulmonarius]|nr:hypothetical protein EYR38_000151 [Pleurotus pulmonarius]
MRTTMGQPDPDMLVPPPKPPVSSPTSATFRIGDFNALTRAEAVLWLKLIGAADLRSRSATDEDVFTRLKHALWDSQRIDNIFHGAVFSEKKVTKPKSKSKSRLRSKPTPKLNPSTLPTWPDWKEPHPELVVEATSPLDVDGTEDAERLDSYVMRHFNTSAFTQVENHAAVMLNPPRTPSASWIDTKARMSSLAMNITRDGAHKFLYETFFSQRNGVPYSNLIVEYMDVKRCPWPEPSPKLFAQFQASQAVKFGVDQDVPLVPMMQTPKFPMILVRYQYIEDEDGTASQRPSHFLTRLQELVRERMPATATPAEVHEQTTYRLQCGLETAEAHLRMFARTLSYNASLLDPAWVNEQQSHWNKIHQDVKKKETREIETGVPITVLGLTCHACEQPAEKLICNSCKSVYYCGEACSIADWPAHKSVCKLSKRLRTHPGDTAAFPPGTFYVPARTYFSFLPPDTDFAVDQEAVRFSGSTNVGEAHRNEYGETRFIVQTRIELGYKRTGSIGGEAVFMWDRRRSLWCRTGPGERPSSRDPKLAHEIPFHANGYAEYSTLLMQRGHQNQLIYLYARRIGDCIELDLKDLPNQADSMSEDERDDTIIWLRHVGVDKKEVYTILNKSCKESLDFSYGETGVKALAQWFQAVGGGLMPWEHYIEDDNFIEGGIDFERFMGLFDEASTLRLRNIASKGDMVFHASEAGKTRLRDCMTQLGAFIENKMKYPTTE